MDYVYDIDDNKVFGVYSNMDNIDYIIVLNNIYSYSLLEVMKMVDEEIEKYITAPIGSDEHYFYRRIGYIECIKRIFRSKGIKAEFYDKV